MYKDNSRPAETYQDLFSKIKKKNQTHLLRVLTSRINPLMGSLASVLSGQEVRAGWSRQVPGGMPSQDVDSPKFFPFSLFPGC